MRLPVRAPHLARCDKIDVLLFNSKTNNSNDALRSKRHAANRTVPQKRKPPINRELPNASACAGSAPGKV